MAASKTAKTVVTPIAIDESVCDHDNAQGWTFIAPVRPRRRGKVTDAVTLERQNIKRATVKDFDYSAFCRRLINWGELADVPAVVERHDENGNVLTDDRGRTLTAPNRTAQWAARKRDELLATL